MLPLKIHAPKTKIPDYSPEPETVHAILSGQLRLTIDGQPLSLKPGDCLFLPHGVTCSTELMGDEPVYMFEAVKVSSSA
jgi:mannose-6-phosphate isomerase-like protein (cupin superfamily)